MPDDPQQLSPEQVPPIDIVPVGSTLPEEADTGGLRDVHSQPFEPADLHSVQVAPEVVEQQVQPESAPLGPAAPATVIPAQVAPVVEATVQATHTAVNTAKQAGHQGTAAVQQQAQKITVAPRKAIYRGKRFMFVYGSLVGAAGLLAVLAR